MENIPKHLTTLESQIKARERVDNCPVAKKTDKRFRVISSLDDKTGRVVRKSTYVDIDRTAEMQYYKVSDFSLDNLISIGASLEPCPTMLGNKIQAIHALENTMSHITNTTKTE